MFPGMPQSAHQGLHHCPSQTCQPLIFQVASERRRDFCCRRGSVSLPPAVTTRALNSTKSAAAKKAAGLSLTPLPCAGAHVLLVTGLMGEYLQLESSLAESWIRVFSCLAACEQSPTQTRQRGHAAVDGGGGGLLFSGGVTPVYHIKTNLEPQL